MVDGDTVVLGGTGSFADPNAGTAKSVTATGITASGTNGAATVYGYQVSPASVSASIGTITPALLTVSGGTTSSTYTAASHTNTFTTSGLLGGDSVTGVTGLGQRHQYRYLR